MKSCPYCEETIGPFDLTDQIHMLGLGPREWHWECAARSVIGSVGHQKRECPCYGGTNEDPPGVTRREAAVAALNYFHKMNLRRRRLGVANA